MGSACFGTMMALGEMATFLPSQRGFAGYAARFFDPALGFAMGWCYTQKVRICLSYVSFRPLTLRRRFRSTGLCEFFLRYPPPLLLPTMRQRDLTVYVTPQHRQQPRCRVHRGYLLDEQCSGRSLAGDLPRVHYRAQPARHSRIRRTRVLDVFRKGSYANRVSRTALFSVDPARPLTSTCRLIILGLVIDLGGAGNDRIGFRYWKEQPFSHYIFQNNTGVFLGELSRGDPSDEVLLPH